MSEKSYKEVIEVKRKEMLNTLLESMENDPGAWQKGWFSFSHIPENGATGKRYRGLNVLFLYGVAKKKGFEDPRWVTFNQAHELGATIKSGEKASSVFFYREYDKVTKRDFDPQTIADLSKEEQLDYRKENVRNVLKFSAVFNAEQCENFPKLERKEMSSEEQEKRNKFCETIINNSAAPIHMDGGDRAYYNPATDSIHLPLFNSFNTLQDFYATALHEIAHSTGYKTRLNRDLSGSFGSQLYALEELRAELSSVFMQVDLGIDLSGAEVKNHAAYLRSWFSAIQDDQQTFYNAAADADKICKYISTEYLKNEFENVKENLTTERFILDFNLDYSNTLLLSNELKKLGFTLDSQTEMLNIKRTGEYMQQGKEHWVNEIKYLGDNGKELSGFYGKTFNGIMAENLQITGFTTLGLSREEVDLVANEIRNLGVDVEIKPHEVEENQQGVTVEVGTVAVAPITAEEVVVDDTVNGKKPFAIWRAAQKEKRLSNIEKNIPQEMKDLHNWCAFSSAKDENGNFKKKIWNCNVGTKTWAKSNDPSTWTTFSDALEYARKNGCDGLSFALTPESGIFCVDLDDCKIEGKYTDTAWGVYNAAKQTYCERSVSGEGLHFFGKKAPGVDFSELGNKNADSTFEFYDRARFMSVTGDVFMKSKSELRVFSDSDKLIPIIKGQLPVKQELKPVTVNHNTASDEDVIARIRKSKKAVEFDRMFAGEDICRDRNRTDLKMMNILGFFTNGDAEQMKRIFESSGLYRGAGEKSRGYIDRTIQKALGSMFGTPDNLGKPAPAPMNKPPLIGL